MKLESKKNLLISGILLSSCLLLGGFSNVDSKYINDDPVIETISNARDEIELPKLKVNDNESIFMGENVSLSDDITFKFYVAKSTEGINRTAKFSLAGVESGVYNDNAPEIEYVNGVECLMFTYKKVTPQYINRDVTITIYEGENVVEERSVSVATYVKTILSGVADNGYADYATRSICVDLLRYGEAAQKYTQVDLDNLATKDVTASDVLTYDRLGNAVDRLAKTDKTWKAAKLHFSSKMGVSFAFGVDKDTDVSSYSVDFTLNGETTNVSAFNLATDLTSDAKDYYEVRFDDISALYFDEVITAQLLNNGNKVGDPIKYSVNSYVARTNVGDFVELARAAYCYGKSAVRYAEKDNDLSSVAINVNGWDFTASTGHSNRAYDGLVYDSQRKAMVLTMDGSKNDYSAENVTIRGYNDGTIILNVPYDLTISSLSFSNGFSNLVIEGSGTLTIKNNIYFSEGGTLTINSNVQITESLGTERIVNNPSGNITITEKGSLKISSVDGVNTNAFAIQTRQFINEGNVEIDANVYAGLHLDNVSSSKGTLTIKNCVNGIVMGSANDFYVEGGNVTLTTKDTAIANGKGTLYVHDGNLTINATGGPVIYSAGLVVGNQLEDGSFTNPTLTINSKGDIGGLGYNRNYWNSEWDHNEEFLIAGQWAMDITWLNYQFISGTTTLNNDSNANVGLTSNNFPEVQDRENANIYNVHENATLNVNGYSIALSGWGNAPTKFITKGTVNFNTANGWQSAVQNANLEINGGKFNITNTAQFGIRDANIVVNDGLLECIAAQHGIYSSGITVNGGKLYCKSNTVGINYPKSINVNGGFLHVVSDNWGVYHNTSFEMNLNAGSVLFQKNGGQGYAAIALEDVSGLVIKDTCKVGVYNYAGAFFSENTLSTSPTIAGNVYTYNLSEGFALGGTGSINNAGFEEKVDSLEKLCEILGVSL